MSSGISKRDMGNLRQYVRHLCDSFGLKDWVFEIYVDKPDSGAYAKCCQCYKTNKFKLWVCPDFKSLPKEEQRTTLIHEMLHIVYSKPIDYLSGHCKDYMPPHAYSVLNIMTEEMIEFQTECLSYALSKIIPKSKIPYIRWAK